LRWRDDQHVRAGLTNFVEMFSHLAEVRQAGDSVQVTKENEQ
jgi:hypothetical protein